MRHRSCSRSYPLWHPRKCLSERSHLVQAWDVVGEQVAHDKPHGKALPARRAGLVPPPQLGQHLRDPPALYGGAV